MTANPNPEKLTYKQALEELEQIVSAMESESVDVDELAVKVKRGAYLIQFCKSKLSDTEREVSSVLKSISVDSGTVTKDMQGTSDSSSTENSNDLPF